VIPDHDLVDEGKQTSNDSKGKTEQSGPTRYIIQAGSFRSLEQADRLKARLALYGIEATIQTVTINNNDTWHRVRIGPMTDLSALNKTRKRLQDNGIATMVVKEKS
jgi:cell division protein FtsN